MEEKKKKYLFVGDSILSLKKATKTKPAEVTFALKVPCYFGEQSKKDVETLVDKLMAQNIGMFSDVKIRGLSLEYNEVE